jgi:hypothetical protein
MRLRRNAPGLRDWPQVLRYTLTRVKSGRRSDGVYRRGWAVAVEARNTRVTG